MKRSSIREETLPAGRDVEEAKIRQPKEVRVARVVGYLPSDPCPKSRQRRKVRRTKKVLTHEVPTNGNICNQDFPRQLLPVKQ